jgi:hypothetical protein
LNYISWGIIWQIFCQTGIFRGVSYSIVTLKRSAIYVKIGEFKKIVSQKEIKGHKNTNAPLILKIWDFIFFVLGKLRSGQFRGQKSLGPLEISLEMAHYVVCPQKK